MARVGRECVITAGLWEEEESGGEGKGKGAGGEGGGLELGMEAH